MHTTHKVYQLGVIKKIVGRESVIVRIRFVVPLPQLWAVKPMKSREPPPTLGLAQSKIIEVEPIFFNASRMSSGE